MEKLKLSLRCERGVKCPPALRARIKTAARTTLDAEEFAGPCELSVLLTDDEGIHAINRQFRDVDRPTDVLSFPMGVEDPVSGRYMLGDMVLNVDRAAAQGAEKTVDMVARHGRIAVRGEGSRGIIDPGAVVAALLINTMAETFAG